jgi:hypothetical protein
MILDRTQHDEARQIDHLRASVLYGTSNEKEN